ncbi:MAG: methylmalonyl Co-A mutase-associated GTPase MeaB [Fluviicola sp.]|nr:MAG: methylmalonyl Co-A mutase-associated GTPase MeaB [Fluviicola sp.]
MNSKNINDWIRKKQERRMKSTPEALYAGIKSGDNTALSEGITLIESYLPEHRALANELVQKCLPLSGNSIRIGITGVPGVGKSTFIEHFGGLFSVDDGKVAVLAVDPSSAVSRGSILGDKTRMNDLAVNSNVFIRPSPAGNTLGGVARKTRESIILCEAAGYTTILVETVGVGQSEVMVKSMVDFFLLLMLSGAGDELQGIKKGIMEMADALVITKADGDNIKKASVAAREYKNALHLFPPNPNNWIPSVFTCSALSGKNMEEALKTIRSFENHVKVNGHFEKNRREQDKRWLSETLKELILSGFFANAELLEKLKLNEQRVIDGGISSFQAAEELYEAYQHGRNI